MTKIKVIINGNEIELENSSTISEMLEERNVVGKMFVVEKNREIIQKEQYFETKVADDDVIEIVGFFGGG